MAVSGQDDAHHPEIVGAVVKSNLHTNQSTSQSEQLQPDLNFDLSSIDRSVPKNIHSGKLFQAKSWYSPPPTPPANLLPSPPSASTPVPPLPPVAPALPFTYIGRMIDGNDVVLFLLKNGRQRTVKENDVLDDAYHVDKITDKLAVLTYLPMNVQQNLAFNSSATPIMNALASATPMPPVPAFHQQIPPAP